MVVKYYVLDSTSLERDIYHSQTCNVDGTDIVDLYKKCPLFIGAKSGYWTYSPMARIKKC